MRRRLLPGDLVTASSLALTGAVMFDCRLGSDGNEPVKCGCVMPGEIGIVVGMSDVKNGVTVCVYANNSFGWIAIASLSRL